LGTGRGIFLHFFRAFVLLFRVLGMKSRTLHMLGMQFYHPATPPTPCCRFKV
jgi:hypothetical protein